MLKRFSILLVAVLFASTLLAAQQYTQTPETPMPLDIPKVLELAKGVTAEKYPEAKTALIDDIVYVTYEANGSYVCWDDMAYKILNEQGKRAYASLSEHFDAFYGKTTYLRATIYKPDGKVIELPVDKLVKEQTDNSSISDNIYDPNDKKTTLNIPGLEIGDVLHVCIKRCMTKPRFPNAFFHTELFEADIPVIRYTLLIDAPKTRPLVTIRIRDEIKGTLTQSTEEKGDRIHYRWQAKDVPQLIGEPQMPSWTRIAQRVLVSTLANWEDVSSWYWNLCLPRLTPSDAMKEKVAELTRDKATQKEKIQAIFTFVSQEIRYMGITTESVAPGYEPHNVSDTFNQRHGVCRDKAALLVAMLRCADIEAFPVLIHVGEKIDSSVPLPYFNHAITAALAEDGSYILMDSTNEHTHDLFPAYLRERSYLVARKDGEKLRVSPPVDAETNRTTIKTTGTVDSDGVLTATSVIDFAGINDNAYRGAFLNMTPTERRLFLEQCLSRIFPKVNLLNYTITPANLQNSKVPVQISITFKAENILHANNDYAIYRVASPASVFGVTNFTFSNLSMPKRRYPYIIRNTSAIHSSFDLQFDPVWGMPEKAPVYETTDNDRIFWKQTVSFKKNTLHVDTDYLVRGTEFTPEQYLQLKDFFRTREDSARKRIIFKRPANAVAKLNRMNPDLLILDQSTEVRFLNLTDTETTTRVRFRILTYKGLKEASEFFYTYNPAYSTVEIVRASVENTAKDGSVLVQPASQKEINEMDADWVSSAPRYPAGKIKVVALPGVKIGSVINLVVKETSRGLPMQSFVRSFGGPAEYLEKSAFRIIAPADIPLKHAVYQNGYLQPTTGLQAQDAPIQETIEKEDDTVTYTWSVKNLPPLSDENSVAPLPLFGPTLYAGVGDWSTYLHELKASLLARCTAGDGIKALVQKIQSEHPQQGKAQLQAVNTFMNRAITTAGPNNFLSLPMNTLTPAEITLSEAYGHHGDKAILAYTILKELGYAPEFILVDFGSAHPVIVRQRYDFNDRSLFSAIFIRVKHAGKTYWLNDQNQYADLETFTGDVSYAITLDNVMEFIQLPQEHAVYSKDVYDIELQDDGQANITLTRVFPGPALSTFKRSVLEQTPEERKRWLDAMVNDISQRAVQQGEPVIDTDASPAFMKIKVKVPKMATIDGNFMYFTLPVSSITGLPTRCDANRKLPFFYDNYRDETVVINLMLPPSFQSLAMSPDALAWSSPTNYGKSRFTITRTQEKENALSYIYKAYIAPDLVFPKDFAAHRLLYEKLNHPAARTIMLRRTATPNP